MKKLQTKIKFALRKHLNEMYVDAKGNLNGLSYNDLNKVLKGYLTCALWTEEERIKEQHDNEYPTVNINDDVDDMDENERLIFLNHKINNTDFINFTEEHIDNDSKIDCYLDIKKFVELAGDDAVHEAVSEKGLEQFGHDIWLSRNHHGAGFFDHWYDNEERLINAANKLGEKTIVLGDDLKLYFE